jgi:hypothetical protein
LKEKGTIRASARIWGSFDAPPNSLKNSNTSLKVKTMEEKGVEVDSL